MTRSIYLITSILVLVLSTGCSAADGSAQAHTAIQSYLEALVAKDANQMIALSCSEWEPQARLEFDSFAAVKVALEDLRCQDAGQEGEIQLVSCTGKIIASYGAEDLVIDLAERTYRAVNEDGEWRMCGYQ